MKQAAGKKESVRQMFNHIAGRYDFLNHFLSLGIDRLWRKKLSRMLAAQQPGKVLDVATGTADLAIELSKHSPCNIEGVDIAEAMLEIGRKKLLKKGLTSQINLSTGESEKLDFADESFDATMVAFGVRNFENLQLGLSEMCRVTRTGGLIAVLEFSRPRHFPVKHLYHFYFRHILPRIGRWISRNKEAYTYLPESVGAFPDGKAFLAVLEQAGYTHTQEKRLTFGIASIYTAMKVQQDVKSEKQIQTEQ